MIRVTAAGALAGLTMLSLGCKDDESTDTAGDLSIFDQRVSDGEHEAEDPSVCMDVKGRIHVVWSDDRGGDRAVYYNRTSDSGASWMGTSIQLNNPDEDGGEAFDPSVACVEDYVYVVWEDLRAGDLDNGNIYFAMSDDGGSTWTDKDENLDVDPEGDTISKHPRIAAGNDAVYVAWVDDRNGAYDVYFQVSTNNGAGWLDEPVRVDSDDMGEAWSGGPEIAVDGDGEVLVVWEDLRNDVSDIYVNHSSDHGRSWGQDTLLSSGGRDSFAPQIVLNRGHAYVSWHDQVDEDVRDVYFSHSGDGGASWPSSPSRAESNAEGFYDAYYPTIAAVGQYMHIAWQDARSNGFDVYYRRSADGGETWYEEEFRLDRDSAGSAQSVRVHLLAEEDGLVVAHWQDYRSDAEGVGVNDLYYNFSEDGGATWQSSDFRVLANEPGTSYAVDAWLGRHAAQLFFVWADGRFGNTDVFFTRLGLGREGGEP